MNNPFENKVGEKCRRAFEKLKDGIERMRAGGREEDLRLCRELDAGKMLGVLIAEDRQGVEHILYAFSGQIGDAGFYHPEFVGPVFDYLQPDGYFKIREAGISYLNRQIENFKDSELTTARKAFEEAKKRVEAEVNIFAEECKKAKKSRAERRLSGEADAAELAEMIRRSQYEKAELRRRKRHAAEELQPFEEALTRAESRLSEMKTKRRRDSEALQRWLFDNFKVLNGRGENRSLSEIFADTPFGIPPSGAGECCAPKLLQAAYLKGWKPIEIAEMWYGREKRGEVRRHGEFYPACRGKCLPILRWMLQASEVTPPLDREDETPIAEEPEIIYEGRWFCVVNKPSGMLTVPGKGKSLSLQDWLIEKFGPEKEVKPAHRLDQDTSGLVIATFGLDSFKTLQSLFATRQVQKTYIAELEGDYEVKEQSKEGRISLPLAPDWLDRPRQRVDLEEGKEAETDYEFIEVRNGRSRVIFHPLTGRTHQLRVHAASSSGLGMPIAGDRLYGPQSSSEGRERLHLHALMIEFTFPSDGRHYRFNSECPF